MASVVEKKQKNVVKKPKTDVKGKMPDGSNVKLDKELKDAMVFHAIEYIIRKKCEESDTSEKPKVPGFITEWIQLRTLQSRAKAYALLANELRPIRSESASGVKKSAPWFTVSRRLGHEWAVQEANKLGLPPPADVDAVMRKHWKNSENPYKVLHENPPCGCPGACGCVLCADELGWKPFPCAVCKETPQKNQSYKKWENEQKAMLESPSLLEKQNKSKGIERKVAEQLTQGEEDTDDTEDTKENIQPIKRGRFTNSAPLHNISDVAHTSQISRRKLLQSKRPLRCLKLAGIGAVYVIKLE